MASKGFSKALRSPAVRQVTSPVSQRRQFVSVLSKVRVGSPAVVRASAIGSSQQVRGIKNIDFAGQKEKVWGKSIQFDTNTYADQVKNARIGREKSYLNTSRTIPWLLLVMDLKVMVKA